MILHAGRMDTGWLPPYFIPRSRVRSIPILPLALGFLDLRLILDFLAPVVVIPSVIQTNYLNCIPQRLMENILNSGFLVLRIILICTT